MQKIAEKWAICFEIRVSKKAQHDFENMFFHVTASIRNILCGNFWDKRMKTEEIIHDIFDTNAKDKSKELVLKNLVYL